MSVLSVSIDTKRADFYMRIDAEIPLHGLTAIFGPSGAGKSTLLRIVAGFDRSGGHVAFDREPWEEPGRFVPPHRRRIATVFQEPRLFAHLDVAGNLAYAARRAGQLEAVPAMVDRFDLGPLLTRRTAGLSGGEAQRVALARALLTQPRLILMDEPLSALDHARRAEILPHIEALRDEARIPILYVSHAVSEVARLAGQVLHLSEGRVLGFGPTAAILADSATSISDPSDPGSLIEAVVEGIDADGLCALSFPGGRLLSPESLGRPGATVRLIIRARDVLIARKKPEGLSALNVLAARVEATTPSGPASCDIVLSCGGVPLTARITRRSAESLGLAPSGECYAIIKTIALERA
ncbi:Thiamine import ATP-binding protein ThiQ [Defluviimonas aquaemixtae]|uniref:Thiamine import ATP-binding protein ThiQ n=1 Tax=Albidovulum aquaemixtae TaxID=1542388 RepID=A0A2R8B771_9RHOB|nr:molybdenum ABC transporter ATP-binding protein [Defluviimonas aquaemixtae]SPH18454.1 Thiamine import ATP-binding protein ThiQ [Defluviimonas aquaemixtae]